MIGASESNRELIGLGCFPTWDVCVLDFFAISLPGVVLKIKTFSAAIVHSRDPLSRESLSEKTSPKQRYAYSTHQSPNTYVLYAIFRS